MWSTETLWFDVAVIASIFAIALGVLAVPQTWAGGRLYVAQRARGAATAG